MPAYLPNIVEPQQCRVVYSRLPIIPCRGSLSYQMDVGNLVQAPSMCGGAVSSAKYLAHPDCKRHVEWIELELLMHILKECSKKNGLLTLLFAMSSFKRMSGVRGKTRARRRRGAVELGSPQCVCHGSFFRRPSRRFLLWPSPPAPAGAGVNV